jgi:ATP-dependent protease ClpP protease subunit
MTKLIRIDGMIGHGEGEITVEDIRAQLPANGTDPIDVRIHSEGGEVFEGFAIYDALKAYKGPKRCVVESSAFSIASFITMAFDEIEITPNGYMMLHNPRLEASGDDEELAKHSEMLAQLKTSMIRVYAERTGKSEEEIAQWLKRESYLNADDAVANGFATRIVGEPVVGRVFARVKDMPHGVVTALFGAGSVAINANRRRRTIPCQTRNQQSPRSKTFGRCGRKPKLTLSLNVLSTTCQSPVLPRRPSKK